MREPYDINKRTKTLARYHEEIIKLLEDKLVLAEQEIRDMEAKVSILEAEKVT